MTKRKTDDEDTAPGRKALVEVLKRKPAPLVPEAPEEAELERVLPSARMSFGHQPTTTMPGYSAALRGVTYSEPLSHNPCPVCGGHVEAGAVCEVDGWRRGA